MKVWKFSKLAVIAMMCLLMSHIPNIAVAEVLVNETNSMIPTSLVLADLNRAQTENEIREFLSTAEVRNQLAKEGVSESEISKRIASLSEQELQQLAGEVKEAKAGGDILFAILIVVLIIYLVKRI